MFATNLNANSNLTIFTVKSAVGDAAGLVSVYTPSIKRYANCVMDMGFATTGRILEGAPSAPGSSVIVVVYSLFDIRTKRDVAYVRIAILNQKEICVRSKSS